MRSLYGVLSDSRYLSLEDLFLSITDRLENDLMGISENAESGDYTLEEIVEQIDTVKNMIVRPSYEKNCGESGKKKYRVEIIETYRRYVEIEAEDEDAAYNDIDNQIAEGVIDLPCDGDDYKYDRELFVSEIKE